MCRFALSLGALFLSAQCLAAPVSDPVRAEIDGLLATLQSSGCEFNRNGTWHTASDAKSHLLKKLAYFEEKSSVQTTEQFIELAASTSSSSGKPYLVRCGASASLESNKWLFTELKAIRASRNLPASRSR